MMEVMAINQRREQCRGEMVCLVLLSALYFTERPHSFPTDPQDSFVEVRRMDISTAVFQKIKLKLRSTM
jgi:hypothetical protein